MRHGAARSSEWALLYVHGYNDYFFCSELGPRFSDRGVAFYALDLRGHGRSLRPGQLPCFTPDLSVYYEEIAAALRRIRDRDGHRRVLLVGSSTGGLTCSLFAADVGGVDALLLNSPFFAFRARLPTRLSLRTAHRALGRLRPLKVVPHPVDPRYAWSLHGSYERGGEWDYDLQLKRPGDLPLRAGWLRAVAKGQARVRRGLHIGCPVLVLVSSHRGGDGEGFDESWFETDTVLDPASIRRQAKQLRGSVVVESVEGGMHDLFLSRLPVRDRVHARIAAWLQGIG